MTRTRLWLAAICLGISACSAGSISLPGEGPEDLGLSASDFTGGSTSNPSSNTGNSTSPSSNPIGTTPTATATPQGSSPVFTPQPTVTPGEIPNASQAALPVMANVVPNLLVFEKRVVGGSHSLDFIVSNGGSEDLTLQSVTSPSSAFQITGVSSAVTLSPGQERTVTVRFAPVSAGTFTGLVSLNFAELAQPKTVEVWGAGVSSVQIRTISSCSDVINVAGATYELQNNISAPGSCLTIGASNVTLDLKGHTVTYGTVAGSPVTCNITGLEDVNCGIQINGTGVVVKNGSVIQGAGASYRNHAIYLGGGAHYAEITGMLLEVSSTSSSNVAANDRKGLHLHHNTIVSHVVRTQVSRSQIEDGSLVHLGYTLSGGEIVRHSIHDNVTRGGNQAVINIYSTGSQIYRNDMSHEGILTNDFAIFLEGSNTEVFQNNIHPVDGRGIHLVGHNHVVRDNIIDVIDLPQSCDISLTSTPARTYENCVPGCQSQGTYGIQIEGNSAGTSTVDALIYGNTITAHADECEAKAFHMSEIHGSNHKIFDNTIQALRAPGSTRSAAAVSFDSVTEGAGFLIKNNQIVSDGVGVHFGYSGGSTIRFFENGFERGPTANSGFLLLSIVNGPTPVSDVQFIDNYYGPGIDIQKPGWWRLDGEYLVRWTLDLTVQNSVGQLLNNAQIVIRDGLGNTAFSGTTVAGKASPVLTQFRKVHTGNAGSDVTTAYNPYTITITPSGGAPYTVPGTITMDQSRALTVQVP